MSWLLEIQAALTWTFAYPLLPLQFVGFCLIAWGRLGYGIGADDLFWSERRWEQILNGFASGLLFGEILLVRHILDPNRTQFDSIPLSLLPVNDPTVRTLGQFLAVFWPASLMILWGFKLFSRDVRGGEVRVLPLLVGLVAAVGTVVAVVSGLQHALPEAWLVDPLLAVSLTTAGLFLALLVMLYAAHFAGAVLSPVVVTCVLLSLADAGYGLLAYLIPGSQYLALLGLVAVGVLVNVRWCNGRPEFRLTLPNLEAEYHQPLDLREEPKRQGKRTDRYWELLADQALGRSPMPNLIPSVEPIRKLRER